MSADRKPLLARLSVQQQQEIQEKLAQQLAAELDRLAGHTATTKLKPTTDTE